MTTRADERRKLAARRPRSLSYEEFFKNDLVLQYRKSNGADFTEADWDDLEYLASVMTDRTTGPYWLETVRAPV